MAQNVPGDLHTCTHAHPHTINICIWHEAADDKKKFRFHNSQYEVINIFFPILCDIFSLFLPCFLFSTITSFWYSIQHLIQYFSHILDESCFKISFHTVKGSFSVFYLIRTNFMCIGVHVCVCMWCVSFSNIFSFSICVLAAGGVGGGRYEIKIKMCSLFSFCGQRSTKTSGSLIHIHKYIQPNKQTNSMLFH